jgi:DNA modification methylase
MSTVERPRLEEQSFDFNYGGFSSYSDWIGNRSVDTLGTNQGAPILAFQNWRRFKEAFAPELVERAVRETKQVRHVVDPFGGSGTTALTAQFLGLRSTTIEVNPFLADLIEAKLAKYDFTKLVKSFAAIMRAARASSTKPSEIFADVPPTLIEPGVNGRYIFSFVLARRLAGFRLAIEKLRDPTLRRFFRVQLASAAVQVSNVVVSGKGRRYRSGWENRKISSADLDNAFSENVLAALYDLRRFESRPAHTYRLMRGDSRLLARKVSPFDLAVFSPPYPNSFDYTDVYNVELWAAGYLKSSRSNRRLREATLRSHVQISRAMDYETFGSRTLQNVLRKLDAKRDQLWSTKIPDMIGAYFTDLHKVISGLKPKLRSGGRLYIVVGDSRYAGIHVPVARVLEDVARANGYRVAKTEPFRSMRASPQQGGRFELSETLLILER